MALQSISYADIKPDMLFRATWVNLGVTSIIQGVTAEQVNDAWLNAQGVTLVSATHAPQKMFEVEMGDDTDIIQSLCEPIQYSEITPGDNIHVIYANLEVTTHFEGIVDRIDVEGVRTYEGGFIMRADDTEDVVIIRILNDTYPASFIPVNFENITTGMFISAEWVVNDVSHIIYATAKQKIANRWNTPKGMTIANKAWDNTNYEESDAEYVTDSLSSWNNVSISDIETGNLICVAEKIDDVTHIREAVVGAVRGTLIFSPQAELLFSGTGALYKLPHYDSV